MFQSTHPRGVRRQDECTSHFVQEFQSTHPRGVRLSLCNLSSWSRKVSIHAPTRGATLGLIPVYSFFLSFNPRTHEGCDKDSSSWRLFFGVSIHAPTRGATRFVNKDSVIGQFQSTHPRGVRLEIRFFAVGEYGFNPRTHEGCDKVLWI